MTTATAIVALLAVVALVAGSLYIRRQSRAMDALRRDLEIEVEWCEYWQQRAVVGDEALEAMAAKHERLQALYSLRTRELLVRNSWIVMAYQRRRN
jgi:hypothetical protein